MKPLSNIETIKQQITDLQNLSFQEKNQELLLLGEPLLKALKNAQYWREYVIVLELVILTYQQLGNNNERMENLLSASNEFSNHFEGLVETKARFLFLWGLFFQKSKGNYSKALEYLHQADSMLIESDPSHRLLLLKVNTQIGTHYLNVKNHPKALLFLQKCLNIPPNESQEYRMKLADSRTQISYSYIETGQIDKGIEHLKDALDTYSNLKSGGLEMGNCLITIGYAYFSKAKQNNSEEDCDQAKLYFQSVLDKWSEVPYYVGKAYIGFALCCMIPKDFEGAQKYYSQALKAHLKIYDYKHPEIARLYFNICSCHLSAENYLLARQSSQEALHCLYPTVSLNYDFRLPPPLEGSSNVGLVLPSLRLKSLAFYQSFVAQGTGIEDLQTALESSILAFEIFNKARTGYNLEESQLGFSKLMTNLDHPEGGIEASLKAEEEGLEVEGKQGKEWAFGFCEKAKASVLMQALRDNWAKTGENIPTDLLQAEKDLQKTLTQLNKNIQKLKWKQEKETLEEKEALQLKEWQQLFFDKHQDYLQLKEQFEENYPNYFQLKHSAKTVEVHELQSVLEEDQVLLNYFVGKKQIYLFVVTHDEFEVLQDEKPEGFEDLVARCLQSIKHHEYQDYVETASELYQILLQPVEDFFIDPIDSEANLKHLIIVPDQALCYLPFEALIQATTNYSARYESDSPSSAAPQQAKTPYASLDYLLNYCTVSYQYSASLFYHHCQRNTLTTRKTTEGFAGFAPVYEEKNVTASTASNSAENHQIAPSKNSQEVLKQVAHQYAAWATRSEAVRSNGSFAPLPFSETEVRNIAQLFEKKGLTSKVYLKERATKEQFEAEARRFKYLLVAAHGLVNDEQTALSGLVFYPNAEKQEAGNKGQEIGHDDSSLTLGKDCTLSMQETYHLDFQADLVVLSSCESGIGRLVGGEGMMAVNRGFLYAGANHVISTLFKVYDRPSSLLTQYLFEVILEDAIEENKGKNYAIALRRAKLRLLKEANVDVKSWCGFVLF